LVDKVLSLGDGQSFPLFDEIEHVLDHEKSTPLVHSYSSM